MTDAYPLPPGFIESPSTDLGGSAVGTELPGSTHAGMPGVGLGGGAGKNASTRHPQCVAVNQRHSGRCQRVAQRGDLDGLCMVHRGKVNRGSAVRCINGKVVQPPEHVTDAEVVSIGHGRGIRRVELNVQKVDWKSLKTIEGRESLEAIAIATVATILQDPVTKDSDRLAAARLVLPKHQLTAEELEQERDLDQEILDTIDQLEREAEEVSDRLAFELLSPRTKALVVAELAAHDIEPMWEAS